MPEFSTEIDIDVDEYWYECSKREKDELIDLLVDKGLVRRIQYSTTTNEFDKPSLLEIEWNIMIDKLSLLRQRLTIEDEETIKKILEKY